MNGMLLANEKSLGQRKYWVGFIQFPLLLYRLQKMERRKGRKETLYILTLEHEDILYIEEEKRDKKKGFWYLQKAYNW